MTNITQLEVAIRRGHLRWLRANLQWEQMMEPTDIGGRNLKLVEDELDKLQRQVPAFHKHLSPSRR